MATSPFVLPHPHSKTAQSGSKILALQIRTKADSVPPPKPCHQAVQLCWWRWNTQRVPAAKLQTAHGTIGTSPFKFAPRDSMVQDASAVFKVNSGVSIGSLPWQREMDRRKEHVSILRCSRFQPFLLLQHRPRPSSNAAAKQRASLIPNTPFYRRCR